MKAIKLKEGIYWVGAIDWNLRNFHGYLTQRGSTYNAYLIIDEKVTLIDTVKGYLAQEMIERISSIIDPSKIDIHISNHTEMDHSGALPAIMEYTPNAPIYCSPGGEKGLFAHYKKKWDFKPVKTGESINIGKRTLQFINTPMVHWPDNMVCYVPEEKILFSNDSFGQHYSASALLDVENPIDIVMEEARKYYANIVLPFTGPVTKEYNAIKDLDIKMIAPSHGVIWTKHVPDIIAAYVDWVSNKTKKKAVIVYDTMWKSTEMLAFKVIADAFEELGYQFKMMPLQDNHISDIMTEFIDAEYICVGSPTLNNQMMPTVAGFLTYLKGLSPKGRKAISFGSYGWGGQGTQLVAKELVECGFELIDEIKVQYIPDNQLLIDLKNNLIQKIKA